MMAAATNSRRMVGDPHVMDDRDNSHRAACLYGAAMLRKVGRLPINQGAVDVAFQPPATIVFVAADASQRELARFVIPDRVLTYDPRPIALPPAGDA